MQHDDRGEDEGGPQCQGLGKLLPMDQLFPEPVAQAAGDGKRNPPGPDETQ